MSAGYQFGTLNREAKLGKRIFTGNLVVDYRRPLPKNGTYLVRLWVEKIVDGRKGSILHKFLCMLPPAKIVR